MNQNLKPEILPKILHDQLDKHVSLYIGSLNRIELILQEPMLLAVHSKQALMSEDEYHSYKISDDHLEDLNETVKVVKKLLEPMNDIRNCTTIIEKLISDVLKYMNGFIDEHPSSMIQRKSNELCGLVYNLASDMESEFSNAKSDLTGLNKEETLLYIKNKRDLLLAAEGATMGFRITFEEFLDESGVSSDD